MRSLVCSLIAVCFALTSAHADVDSKKISEVARKIGKIAEGGVSTTKVKPGSARKMVEAYIEDLHGELEEGAYKHMTEEFDYTDEMSMGTTSMKGAIKLTMNQNFGDELTSTQRKERAEMRALIRELVGTGVVFGYNGYGQGVCGVSVTSLLILDTAKGNIHDVSLMDFSGGC